MHEHDDIEPPHHSSSTDHITSQLQLYGWRPAGDEADPRPMPEDYVVAGAITHILDPLSTRRTATAPNDTPIMGRKDDAIEAF